MRVYLPGTIALLRDSVARGQVHPPSGIAFAVTQSLQSEYPDTDSEELEYLAMTDAARASLRLLAESGVAGEAGSDGDQPDAPATRVVIAADVATATPYPRGDRAAVKIAGAVPWADVAAVHMDGADVAEVVRAAVDAVDAADLGDLDAEFAVGEATSHELAWYAPGEVAYLLEELS
ncbi:MAG: hypothetical protein M3Y77_12505 [Actinomycetota bacterium]|nr:hypothetical protein [Actinomycetota bacterium]